ncbi:hypothetical protein CWI84_11665 [Idiomarina tyrosinivorans]|uniref:Carbohydrate porin n=1 Tax=Idiomarina tyrosinivorans TaxID=1445662 RepID=A0A432ZFA5_9GAMM|nr:carbohydrate porin [Idiomarina tyrosinivorans]RUO76570.1 hypothetical protein CWI84_11665 [Idiomarina tyrosinivorans]
MYKRLLPLSLAVAAALPAASFAQDGNDLAQVKEEIAALKQQIAKLEQKLEQEKQQQADEQRQLVADRSQQRQRERRRQPDTGVQARLDKLESRVDDAQNWPIRIGGAVRFQYVYENYNTAQQNRTGDFDFDIFRLDFDGEIGGVILSAQYRWFQYMEAVQHAWFGYNFTPELQGQVGVVKVPFGNMPYNSHSYFFDSTFYVGLEDEHDNGVRLKYRSDQWDFDVGFYKSDEQGGVDGFVSDRTARYSYDPVGILLPGQGVYDKPGVAIGESNSWAVRGAHKWHWGDSEQLELGVSSQWGNLYSPSENVGNRKAYAVHGVYNNGPWEVMLQYSDYEYDMDIENRGISVGAYAFYDGIPASAKLYTGNVAYTLPVDIGPITSLTFYNDYSLTTDREGYHDDTWMNITGVAVAAGGGVYTYVDLVKAKNHPFIGGSMAQDGGEVNTRFNINFGYYF